MRVTLLGTGDTTGTPTVGCDCDTCRRARERGVERTRPAIHIENERTEESLLIDASPDFRQQFLTHDVSLPDAAVITHIHFDHLDGLGNAYRVFDDLPVHAAAEVDPKTDESVAATVKNKYHYLSRISVEAHDAYETFPVCGLEVTLVPVEHPPLLSYGVVIDDPETGARCSFTGDTNYAMSDDARAALSDPELLIADAIVPASLCEHHPMGGRHHDENGVPRTFGHKHMTREGALDMAEELSASKTRLVHVAHFYPVEEAFEDPLALDGEQHEI
jgi:phosphoribosyl 1,2-cyclic phosphate phosphodiesterase